MQIRLFFLLFSLLLPFHAAQSAGLNTLQAAEVSRIEKALKAMYERYPSTRLLTDRARLVRALKLVDPQVASRISEVIKSRPEVYDAARDRALAKAVMPPPTKTAVVSGAAGAGGVAARVLREANYQVTAIEKRPEPTRQINWGGRQAFAGTVRHVFGPEAGNKFVNEVTGSVGEHYVRTDNGVPTKFPLPKFSMPGSASLTGQMDGNNLLKTSSSFGMEVGTVEKFLREQLANDPRVNLKIGTASPVPTLIPGTNKYAFGDLKPDLAVTAEGGNSATAKALGMASVPASPSRFQVAGVISVNIPGGFVGSNHFSVPGQNGQLVTGIVHRDGSGKVWLVTDLDAESVEPPKNYQPGTPEYLKAQSELVEKQYRAIAARALNLPESQLAGAKIVDPMGKPGLKPFNLQQNLTVNPVVGNVLAVGDVVGTGHWSAGGGGYPGLYS